MGKYRRFTEEFLGEAGRQVVVEGRYTAPSFKKAVERLLGDADPLETPRVSDVPSKATPHPYQAGAADGH